MLDQMQCGIKEYPWPDWWYFGKEHRFVKGPEKASSPSLHPSSQIGKMLISLACCKQLTYSVLTKWDVTMHSVSTADCCKYHTDLPSEDASMQLLTKGFDNVCLLYECRNVLPWTVLCLHAAAVLVAVHLVACLHNMCVRKILTSIDFHATKGSCPVREQDPLFHSSCPLEHSLHCKCQWPRFMELSHKRSETAVVTDRARCCRMRIWRTRTACFLRWAARAIPRPTSPASSGCATKASVTRCWPLPMPAMPMTLAAAYISWASGS